MTYTAVELGRPSGPAPTRAERHAPGFLGLTASASWLPCPTMRTLPLLLVIFSLALLLWVLPRAACAQEVSTLAQHIRHLQPATTPERADSLARIIADASAAHDLPSLLVVSLIFYESSFFADIERLERFGPRGERGLMQLHPRAGWQPYLPEGCTAELVGAECQIRTGVAWLAEARRRCPGSPYRWVAAYGSSRCLGEREAGLTPWVRYRVGLFVRLGGTW